MKFLSRLIRLLHIPAYVSVSFIGAFVLMPDVAVAMDNSTQHRWAYGAAVGFEGQAFVTNGDAARMEMECGNGGGPAIAITAASISQIIPETSEEFISLTFAIDNKNWTEKYKCSVETSQCGSFGFPSIELIKALRQGQNVTVLSDEVRLATFSLKGSNATIAHLSSCLGPDVY